MRLRKARVEIRHWHEEFVLQFHQDDHQFMNHLYMKYDHSQRVMNDVRGIAEALKLTSEVTVVAELAALFHDLGRYMELLEYTKAVKSAHDHALLSVKILQEENALFPLPRDLAQQVYQVIRYHNVVNIPDDFSQSALLPLKILRDADKIDIWRMISAYLSTPPEKRKELIEINVPEGVSVQDSVIERLIEGAVVKSSEVRNLTELKLQYISWVYDINIPWTYQVVLKRAYVSKIIATLPLEIQEHRSVQNILVYIEENAALAQKEGFRGR